MSASDPTKVRFKEGDVSRRGFVKLLSALTAGVIAVPKKSEAFNLDAFIQKHFHQMSDQEMQKTLARLEKECIRSTIATISRWSPMGLSTE